ncbi:MAG: hypothetical protein OXI58_10895 [Gemmatimonadota bacterium]|nr:hypothetical protein [Gemmatimonadota bacterium]
MPRSINFAHYLMGHAPFRRTSFFYAYAGMWLHLLIGTGLLALSGARDWLSIFTALVVGSFCAGLALYGLLTKTRRLLLNIGAYAASIARAFSTDPVVITCFIAGLIAALVSSYSILAAEYGHYQRECHRQPVPLPASVPLLLGVAIVLLCAYGLLAS